MLQIEPKRRLWCHEVSSSFADIYRKCREESYCVDKTARSPSTVASPRASGARLDLQPLREENEAQSPSKQGSNGLEGRATAIVTQKRSNSSRGLEPRIREEVSGTGRQRAKGWRNRLKSAWRSLEQ